MDFWQRAINFAEETAKRSQELTKEAAKRSQDLTNAITASSSSSSSYKISDLVSETTRRSKEIAAEASKRADLLKLEALRRADNLKSFAAAIPLVDSVTAVPSTPHSPDLELFGVTHDLREFVKGITSNTFEDFPLQDDTEVSDTPSVSNVRQDLTEWQEKHAKLVLATVKEISKLRYALCPRVMKERKFWRIYFILVNSHVSPYEMRYMEEFQMKTTKQLKDNAGMEKSEVEGTSKLESKEVKNQIKTSKSSNEQDLDVFLLGDPGDSDEGPDDGDGSFDDDFDKTDISEDEKEK